MAIELILQCNKVPFVTDLNQIEAKMHITKCFCITNACLNSSTLSFSSLDLFIGQASLATCSGRVYAGGESGREVWKKPFLEGETDSPEPVTGVTGCDGLLVMG